MKRIISAILITALSVSSAMATKSAAMKSQFNPIDFNSTGPDDLITITTTDSVFSYAVLITVAKGGYPTAWTGVNISNCGEVKHLNQGSSVICKLYADRPPVTISSDKQGVTAAGSYQIQKQ